MAMLQMFKEVHPLNREIAKKVLEKKGIDVYVADNGQTAIDKVISSNEGFFDAILMDIRMPVLDGLEATRRIRKLDRRDVGMIPIIAMSANAYAEDIEKSREAGIDKHLSKPIDPNILYQTLTDIFKKRQI